MTGRSLVSAPRFQKNPKIPDLRCLETTLFSRTREFPEFNLSIMGIATEFHTEIYCSQAFLPVLKDFCARVSENLRDFHDLLKAAKFLKRAEIFRELQNVP